MKVTLDLDDDILRAAGSLAEARKLSLSRIVSELFRKALQPVPIRFTFRNGFPVLPGRAGGKQVTPWHVAELLDEMQRESLP